MNRPLTITSTTHAFVVGIYGFMIALGVLHALDMASHEALTDLVGTRWTDCWIIAHIGGGAAALAGVLIAARQGVPIGALWAEAIGVATLAFVFVVYNIALQDQFGVTGVVTTQALGWAVALSSIARIVQIIRDQARIRRAVRARVYADPPPLADPADVD